MGGGGERVGVGGVVCKGESLMWVLMSLHCTDMGVALSTGAPVESCDMGVVSALFRWPPQFIFPGTYMYVCLY